MSKKMIFTLSMFVAVLALSFNSITTHAMGFTPDDDPILVQPEDETSEESDSGIYSDVNEMADRIVTTEDNILIMSDRIVETEEIVAGVSPADEFDSEALDASSDVRDAMDDALIDNMLPEVDFIDENLPENETILGLSDDIGEMADRILYTEDEIGTMADRIVETEYLIADTIGEIDGSPNITTDDFENAPELTEHTLEQIDETTPSTDTVTDAAPVDSLGEDDVLALSNDIGDMADNILDTEGDIGETADNIVETENELSDSLVSFWN
ncbi:MAG: hypothetical protein DRI32_05040 [Chloroflexi bacterium]|nr:MAG: hypothetical protein DRI32_05040 [Chloroflexota bacterium]